MSPTQSYRIWFTPRTGSTLLCKGLEQTGVAGQPGEFFNVPPDGSLCNMHQAKNYGELQRNIWQLGTSANGVFGMKHSSFKSRYNQIYQEICSLKSLTPTEPQALQEVLADLFPKPKHIYLTRRNKVRQAVSWWKAIKDEQWHIASEAKPRELSSDFYEQEYVYPAIRHLVQEAALRECATEAYFDRYQLRPLTIVYEDMVRDFKGTISHILAFLELDDRHAQTVKPYYKRTATPESEEWVQRFRQEWQAELGQVTW